MNYKKLLIIIVIVIGGMFALMLTTSYAWYSFAAGSTTFEAVTNNEDIEVTYAKGDIINTIHAIPITSDLVNQYSEKNRFMIRVKDNVVDNEIVVSISLVDIKIDPSLQNVNFKTELYYQGSLVASFNGDTIGLNGEDTKEFGDVTLNSDIDNNFELRVYILDDGSDQSNMMGKIFQGKIKVDVVSRLKTSFTDFTNPDIAISSIKIDGEQVKQLPTSGYYTMTSTCLKGSVLTWDALKRTIIYEKGSKVNDSCSLEFTKSTDYPLLSSVEVGSYVKYVGNNGCDGDSCRGVNANYVSDDDMGYCDSAKRKFVVNGFRLAYVEDGVPYLISAGSPECLCTSSNGKMGTSCEGNENALGIPKHLANLNRVALKYCNASYAYDGVCNKDNAWNVREEDFQKISSNVLSSCHGSSSQQCGFVNDLLDNGGSYWFSTAVSVDGATAFIWNSTNRAINSSNSNSTLGVRPVLRLDSSVKIVDGVGDYDDPYILKK